MEHIEASAAAGGQRYGLMAFLWSLLVAVSLAWNLYQEDRDILRLSKVMTRANIKKDISLRKWVAAHGGIYVAPTEHTPPNPYLDPSGRDLTTTTGKVLTLMNPAYVLRELQADFPDDYGTHNRVVSLNPLNPVNAPDAWEAKALKSFEQGNREYWEIQQVDGKPFLRMMQPLIVEKECMACHALQGYRVGDVRGGIGSSVPLERFMVHYREHAGGLWLSYGVVWLIGMVGLGFSWQRDRRIAAEKQQVQQKLHDQLDELLRFQKLTVGRELRMKELVEENAALRNQLDSMKHGGESS